MTSILNHALADRQAANPNLIVDGDFRFWFEGDSQTNSGYGSATMWSSYHASTTKTVSRQTFADGQTDVPGAPRYFCRTVFSGGAQADSRVVMEQKQESINSLFGKRATVSFYAKADADLQLGIDINAVVNSLNNSTGPKVVNLTTSWQKFSVTLDVPFPSGLTEGTGDHTDLRFWLTTAGDFTADSGIGVQSGTVDIAHVKLEEGPVATEGGWRNEAEELALVSRYYEQTEPEKRIHWITVPSGSITSGNRISFMHRYSVEKRDTPSVILTGTHETSGLNIQTITNNTTEFSWRHNSSSSVTPADHYYEIIADSRL